MKKFIKYLKNILIGIFFKISIFLHSLEKQFLGDKVNGDEGDDDTEHQYIKSDLLRSLVKGEYNKEYADKFYAILKKSDTYLRNDSEIIKNNLKNHGMDTGNQDLHFFLNSGHKYKNDTLDGRYLTDEYELEYIKKNIRELSNLVESANGADKKYNTSIKTNSENNKYKIEHYCDFLHIKKIDETNKILEFYVEESFKHIIDFLIKIDYVTFKNEYGDKYGYNELKHIGNISNNNYLVLKFKANAIK